MSVPAPMLLTLALGPSALGAVVNPALEMIGRGYARVPTGTLYNVPPDPTAWTNALPLLWPQAPVDWGVAPYLTLIRESDGIVLSNSVNPPNYVVLAGDQPRIAPAGLYVYGVGPNTDRPYGDARYGESTYSAYPAAGDVFFDAAILSYQWDRQANVCAAWTSPAALVVGGCA